MKYNDLQDGINVKIVSAEKTNFIFGITEEMSKMVGNVYRIKEFYEIHGQQTVIIKTWKWHPADLTRVDKIKKKKIETVMFDSNNLFSER